MAEIAVDVEIFLETTTLPANVVKHIRNRQEVLKHKKGIFSVNDAIGKEIASCVFGDLASAHFRRWLVSSYTVGETT